MWYSQRSAFLVQSITVATWSVGSGFMRGPVPPSPSLPGSADASVGTAVPKTGACTDVLYFSSAGGLVGQLLSPSSSAVVACMI